MPGIIPPSPSSPQIIAARKQRAAEAARAAAVAANSGTKLVRLSPLDKAAAAVTGGVSVKTPAGSTTMNVRGLQQMLKNQGYDIAVDGTLGPQTLRALQNWGMSHQLTGAESAALSHAAKGELPTVPLKINDWNQRFGQTPSKSFVPATKTNAAKLTGTGPGGSAGTVDLTGLQKMLTQPGSFIPTQEANFGTMIDPKTADAIAGQQYDAQIAAAQRLVNQDPLQAAMNQKDIGGWYGQVMDALNTATGRDSAAETAGISSITDAGKSILASLGGSANLGAADVGTTATNDANTLKAMGVAQDQYNTDMAPILAADRANQLTNQKNKDALQLANDRATLSALQGQRGDALTAAQAQIDQANNALAADRAKTQIGIQQSNNQLAQQGYNNALGLAQAQIAAEMSGLKLQAEKGLANSRAGTFDGASPSQKYQAYANAMASLYDPNTKQKLNLTPQQAQQRVQSILSGYGWQAAPGTPAGNFAAGIVSTWQTAG